MFIWSNVNLEPCYCFLVSFSDNNGESEHTFTLLTPEVGQKGGLIFSVGFSEIVKFSGPTGLSKTIIKFV